MRVQQAGDGRNGVTDNIAQFPQAPGNPRPFAHEPHVLAAMDTLEEWAAGILRAEQATPWDWYELMKLRDAMFALRGEQATGEE